MQDEPPPMPRWVKFLGGFVLVLVVLFIGLHLAGLSPSHQP